MTRHQIILSQDSYLDKIILSRYLVAPVGNASGKTSSYEQSPKDHRCSTSMGYETL